MHILTNFTSALPEPTFNYTSNINQKAQSPPKLDPLNTPNGDIPSPATSPNKVNGAYPGMDPTTRDNGSLEPKNRTVKPLDTQNWFQKVEEIKVTIAPEREGFIFKHVNYIVESQTRSSIVLRRFSDFWWLMEVLAKRYPFRALPNLPPKKMGGSKPIS